MPRGVFKNAQENQREVYSMRVGLDIGSTTIKCVVLNENDGILYSTYERHFSHILEKAK